MQPFVDTLPLSGTFRRSGCQIESGWIVVQVRREEGLSMPSKRNAAKRTKKTGMVTAFNEKRRVGYIVSDESPDADMYVVHQKDIDLPGYAVLESGQLVEFEVADDVSGDDGEPVAENVRPTTTA